MPYDTLPVHAEDERFGAIGIWLDGRAGTLEVEGAWPSPGIPTVTLDRDPLTEAEPHIPIGTRDGSRLTLVVGDETARIRPGRGRFLRRSYAVDVVHRGSRYRLVPDSAAGSRLLRNGRPLGRFSSDGDGVVRADWAEDAVVEAVDAALGHALAAAFGTGGRPWWALVADFAGDLIPD
ncbi:hypothetical protein V1L54_25345 [Streptomyces sp. TRM 70361]|uniref:hypothetical protein n=1 Tax=Streptomyces sp. TRM 70361 TaxID=3116553 RepID=UPI002E7BFC19|nr:hypothetical protein [Streptomyces sp. TRM 70361]MEE1942692.1 hypothetical protein [Streptomyces sp. TRM 70361]